MKKVFYAVLITLMSTSLFAQTHPNFASVRSVRDVLGTDTVDARIEAGQIKYWVGEGSHSVIFAANWADPDTALAWGYRFSEDSVTVFAVMDALAKADQRFSYDTSIGTYGPYLNDLWFATSTGDTLKLAGNYWMINVNGMGAANGIASQYVKDNDFVKVGDESAGILKDPNTFWYVWITAVMPVDVPAAVANVQEELMVEVYPNPASDYVQIRYAEAQPATLVLVDMQGRMLKQLRISGDFRMDVSGLAAGMYIVRLQNGDASAIRKIQVR